MAIIVTVTAQVLNAGALMLLPESHPDLPLLA
jgi:hypothetical protein